MVSSYEFYEKWHRDLEGMIYDAHTSFCVWSSLKKMRAPNILGKEAHGNSAIMGSYSFFFQTIERSLVSFSLLELAKVFESEKKDGINIKKFLKKIPKDKKEEYLSIIEEINKKYACNKKLIDKLIKWKNKRISHLIFDAEVEEIKVKEMKELEKIALECFNTMSSEFKQAITDLSHLDDICYREVSSIILSLKEYRKLKMRQILKEGKINSDN